MKRNLLYVGLLSLSLLMGCSFADDESLSSNVSSDNSSSSSSSAQENDLFYFEQDIIYLPLEEDTPVKLNLIKEGKYKDTNITLTYDETLFDIDEDLNITHKGERVFSSIIATAEDGLETYCFVNTITSDVSLSETLYSETRYDWTSKTLQLGGSLGASECVYVFLNGRNVYQLRNSGYVPKLPLNTKQLWLNLPYKHNEIMIFSYYSSNRGDYLYYRSPLIIDFNDDQDLVWRVARNGDPHFDGSDSEILSREPDTVNFFVAPSFDGSGIFSYSLNRGHFSSLPYLNRVHAHDYPGADYSSLDSVLSLNEKNTLYTDSSDIGYFDYDYMDRDSLSDFYEKGRYILGIDNMDYFDYQYTNTALYANCPESVFDGVRKDAAHFFNDKEENEIFVNTVKSFTNEEIEWICKIVFDSNTGDGGAVPSTIGLFRINQGNNPRYYSFYFEAYAGSYSNDIYAFTSAFEHADASDTFSLDIRQFSEMTGDYRDFAEALYELAFSKAAE